MKNSFSILIMAIGSMSCAGNSDVRSIPRGEDTTISGAIAYQNDEYEFFLREKIYVDGKLMGRCISILPNELIRRSLNMEDKNKKDVTVRAVLYFFPNDLGYSDAELISTNVNLACGNNTVMLIKEFK